MGSLLYVFKNDYVSGCGKMMYVNGKLVKENAEKEQGRIAHLL
jgi:hypothetical protein